MFGPTDNEEKVITFFFFVFLSFRFKLLKTFTTLRRYISNSLPILPVQGRKTVFLRVGRGGGGGKPFSNLNINREKKSV